MSYTLLVRPVAERDLAEARAWYLEQAPHVVDRLEQSVDDVFRRLVEAPFRYRTIVRDARRVHCAVFPYEVWYRVHENRHVIEVVAVVHDRQDLAVFSSRVDP